MSKEDTTGTEKGAAAAVALVGAESVATAGPWDQCGVEATGACGMGLLRLPRLSEMKEVTVDFEDDPTVDFDAIPYKDPKREEKRLAKLVELRKKHELAAKKRPARELTLNERKKMKNMIRVGPGKNNKWAEDELRELMEDARAIRKARRNKRSQRKCDEFLERSLPPSHR